MNPEAVVQRQLDAYNARDLARFVACYADDVSRELSLRPLGVVELGKSTFILTSTPCQPPQP
jgi:ketosteroid isomerase-like protein